MAKTKKGKKKLNDVLEEVFPQEVSRLSARLEERAFANALKLCHDGDESSAGQVFWDWLDSGLQWSAKVRRAVRQGLRVARQVPKGRSSQTVLVFVLS